MLASFCTTQSSDTLRATVGWICRELEIIYSPLAGRVNSAVSYSSPVKKGEPLVALTDPDLEIQFALLKSQTEERQCELESAQLRADQQPAILAQLPILESTLWDVHANSSPSLQD